MNDQQLQALSRVMTLAGVPEDDMTVIAESAHEATVTYGAAKGRQKLATIDVGGRVTSHVTIRP